MTVLLEHTIEHTQHDELESKKALQAIKTIMRRAVFLFAEIDLKSLADKPGAYTFDIGTFFKELTDGNCERISSLELYDLRKNHASLFKQSFLVKAHRMWNQKFIRKDWHYHVYAFAEDTQGMWYGFSPANFGVDGANPLTTIFSGSTLDELLKKVESVEGGVWPLSSVLEQEAHKFTPKYPTDVPMYAKRDNGTGFGSKVVELWAKNALEREDEARKYPVKKQLAESLKKVFLPTPKRGSIPSPISFSRIAQ